MSELYRDPVYDGATDPKVVIDDDGVWWMFYTQRRASLEDAGPGVSWVHGSRVGVASSPDGARWVYRGTLEPSASDLVLDASGPPAEVHRTHWAPEVINDGSVWHMYLTEIDGVPDRWPGFARSIVEYVSDDLRTWRCRGPLALRSDRVIDAAVARTPDGCWRLWYKDEAAGSTTAVAVSHDLSDWADAGIAIGGRAHEGPDVFELGGWFWMIVDEWRGMGVHRSTDGIGWVRQGGADAVILDAAPAGGIGSHGAHVRDGDTLWFYYFARPADAAAHSGSGEMQRSAIYRVALRVVDGVLVPGDVDV
ncbi:hypothetical protein [Microbacterium sp.]|uniref:hypothetical protein n=1 Tax=Microbacterium sp. TaxID=51671 RepID=UPI0039E6B77B